MIEERSIDDRLLELSDEFGNEPALIQLNPTGDVVSTSSWTELDQLSGSIAESLDTSGVGLGDTVVVAARNDVASVSTILGVLRLGGLVLPIRPQLNGADLAHLVDTIKAKVVIGDPSANAEKVTSKATLARSVWRQAARSRSSGSVANKAITSGGSTGSPKIIIDPHPWTFPRGMMASGRFDLISEQIGFKDCQSQLVVAPITHNAPFCWGLWGLLSGQRLYLTPSFDAAGFLRSIEKHSPDFVFVVPTMFHRVNQVISDKVDSLSRTPRVLLHGGGPCHIRLKRRILQLFDASSVFEIYGQSEALGILAIDGKDWLNHPGSVGQPKACEIRIRSDSGDLAQAGESGRLFMRCPSPIWPPYRYIGADALEMDEEGFVFTGDIASTDEQNHVRIVGRADNVIVVGGSNITSQEVEAVLANHPDVLDVAAAPVDDDEYGQVVGVAVVARPGGDLGHLRDQLLDLAMQRLPRYAIPRLLTFLPSLPRTEAGKLQRRALVVMNSGTTFRQRSNR